MSDGIGERWAAERRRKFEEYDTQARNADDGPNGPITSAELSQVLKNVGAWVDQQIDEAAERVKRELQIEFRSVVRKARLRRWSRKDIDRYVQSQRTPEEVYGGDGS